MFDGAELAEAIAAHPEDLDRALAEFETAMFARSAAEAVEPQGMIELCLGDDVPSSFIAAFSGADFGSLALTCGRGSGPDCRGGQSAGRGLSKRRGFGPKRPLSSNTA